MENPNWNKNCYIRRMENITVEPCLESPSVNKHLGYVIATLGIITNSVIIAALIRSKKLRKNAYIVLVLLLSICDILLCLSSVLLFIVRGIIGPAGRSDHRGACAVAIHFLLTSFASSLGQTLLICLNRLLAATGRTSINQLLFHERRKFISSIVLFLFWQVYFVSMIPLQNSLPTVSFCGFCSLYTGEGYWWAVLLNTCAFVGVFLMILVLYIILFIVIRRQGQKIIPGRVHVPVCWTIKSEQSNKTKRVFLGLAQAASQPNGFTEGQKLRMNALKTLSILLVIFSLLTMPLLIGFVLEIYNYRISKFAHFTTAMLALVNTVTNPILYTWRFEELRKELRKLLRI